MKSQDLEKFNQLKLYLPDVSRETFFDLVQLEKEVIKWQKLIHLVSASNLQELWARHILDSVQIFTLSHEKNYWLDLGSGGGFPGLVIAILLKNERRIMTQEKKIFLVESNKKKAAFLQNLVTKFNLPAQVYAKRIENLWGDIKNIEVITARALASLDVLLHFVEPWMHEKTIAFFPKGKDYAQEIIKGQKKWDFSFKIYESRVQQGSVILKITELKNSQRGLIE